jgi:hypothetical protein
MSLRIVTSFATLMQYAHALGQARLRNDPEEIARAEAQHNAYRDLCLREDVEMLLHTTAGDLHR